MADMKNIHKEITIPNRIFLKGFDLSTKEEDIRNIFIKYGSIVETNIIKDSFTGHSRGFGFITFDSQQVAEHVLATCKSIELSGIEVTVGPAKIRRRPPKYFRQNYYNGNTTGALPVNGCYPPFVSSNYTVSPNGLFTFHQPLSIAPPPPPPSCHTYPKTYPPFIDPAVIQYESEAVPAVVTSISQETNCPAYYDSVVDTSVRLEPAGNIIINPAVPKSPMNHMPTGEVAINGPPNGNMDITHCLPSAPPPAVHPNIQHLNGYYSNGHIANINNHFVNINGHHVVPTTGEPKHAASYLSSYEIPVTSMDLSALTNTLPTSSVNFLPIATVLAPDHKNMVEAPKLKMENRVNMVADHSTKQASHPCNKVSAKVHDLANKPLKSQKFIFMPTSHGKVKRVVVH